MTGGGPGERKREPRSGGHSRPEGGQPTPEPGDIYEIEDDTGAIIIHGRARAVANEEAWAKVPEGVPHGGRGRPEGSVIAVVRTRKRKSERPIGASSSPAGRGSSRWR